MSGTFTYRTPTTPAGPGWSEDLGDEAVRLGKISGISQQAQLGSVDIGSIPLDDPDSDIGHDGDGIVGLKQFDWREGECPVGQRVIWTGYIGPRTYRRGDGDRPSLIQNANRWIDVSLVDINAFLSFRTLVDAGDSGDASFDRPAETDIERVQALLAIYYLSDTLFDGLVATSGGVNMDANDYTGQRPIDVLNDCAQQSGRNFFVWYDEAGTYTPDPGDFALFYDFNESPVFPANDPDFRVSNVLTDCDRTGGVFTGPTWPPSHDAELTVDPTRIATAAQMKIGTTSVYRQQITTSYKFAYRDMDASSPDVKTVPLAEARLDRYLASLSTEDANLTFRMKLPAANVNDWMPGQYVPVRFSHLKTDALDLATEFRNVRCLRRTVSQDEETDAFYNIEYECTPMLSEPSGAFSLGSSSIAYSGQPTLPRETTPGNILLAACIGQGFTTDFPADVRFLDNPPVSPASPAVPPFADHGGWTVLGMAQTDASGCNIGGPCAGFSTTPYCTSGIVIAWAWRYVQPGELTTVPVAASTETIDAGMSIYVWELPTTIPPTLVDTQISTHSSLPVNTDQATASGNLVALHAFWVADSGHEKTTLTPNGAAVTVRSANGANDPTTEVFFGWDDPWVWIGQLTSGGVIGCTYSPLTPTYTSSNWCGLTIELPPGITLPDIPFPANQSA